MKRKLFATLLAVSMAISLCAFGNQGESSVSQPDVNPTTDESTTNNVPENPVPDNQQTEGDPTTGEENTPDVTQDVSGGGTIDTPAPEDSETGKPEGLFLMTVTDMNMRDPKISCVNIETGESTVIAEFNFVLGSKDQVVYSPAARYSVTCQNWFSYDYSKIAVTRQNLQTGEVCAGWIDVGGNFFNVSETLGQLGHGDFDDPVMYAAIGFTDDGLFVYKQTNSSGLDSQGSYHYVPVDNISPAAIQDGCPIPGSDDNGSPNPMKLTDCIDESTLLINTSEGFTGENAVSKIYNLETGEETVYVPGTSRMSWNGVLSPDGSQVAFMSRPKNGTEIDIYTMPLGGGDPVKVSTDGFSLSYWKECENGYDYDGQVTMLVGWR